MAASPVDKWRPPLSLIVGAVLMTVLALPASVLFLVWPVSNGDIYSLQVAVPVLAVVVIFVAVLGGVFVRTLTGPVQELTERTARLTAGDRTAIQPLNRHGSREIADLSSGLFGMADALFERSDYIANFATHVGHEVKTPLTSIRGSVELILDEGETMTPEDRQRFLGNILEDTRRITALLDRLRELAHADNPREQGQTTLEHVATAITRRFPDLTIELQGPMDQSIAITEENATIIFSNLVENAVQHGAKKVAIVVRREGADVVVDVVDDGSGVSEGNESRIFDLFFTTRRSSGGTGMGLGIARSMLQAHNGDIALKRQCRSAPTSGAAFSLRVPAV